MTERDFETEFWEIIAYQASLEPRMREVVGWTMGQVVDLESVPEPDYHQLSGDFRVDWGLDEKWFDIAIKLCEDQLGSNINESTD